MFATVVTKSHRSLAALTLTLLASTALGPVALQAKDTAATSQTATKIAATDAGSKAPIKLGYMTSLTGPAAENCQEMVDGAKLYLEQVKNKMAGRQVELIVKNDGSSKDGAKDEVKKLVADDRISLLDGLMFSHIAYEIAPLVNEYKLPTILNTAAADNLTQREHSEWIARAGVSSSQASQVFGDWVYKNTPYKKIVTLAVDTPWGAEVTGGFQKSYEDAGGKIVQKLWAPMGLVDFSSIIKQVRKDADALYIVGVGEPAWMIPKQCKEQGVALPILGGGNTFDEVALPHLDDKFLNGLSAMAYSSTLKTPDNEKFVQAFKAKYDHEPSWPAECAYTSMMIINKTLDATKGDIEDRAKFMDALKKIELAHAPRGPLKFDEYGNPIQTIYIRKLEKVNGKLENVVVKAFPNISQFWKWTPAEYLKQPVYSKKYPACKNCS